MINGKNRIPIMNHNLDIKTSVGHRLCIVVFLVSGEQQSATTTYSYKQPLVKLLIHLAPLYLYWFAECVEKSLKTVLYIQEMGMMSFSIQSNSLYWISYFPSVQWGLEAGKPASKVHNANEDVFGGKSISNQPRNSSHFIHSEWEVYVDMLWNTSPAWS